MGMDKKICKRGWVADEEKISTITELKRKAQFFFNQLYNLLFCSLIENAAA